MLFIPEITYFSNNSFYTGYELMERFDVDTPFN